MAQQKEYNIKIYDQDGTTFITSVTGKQVSNDIQFKSVLNGGFGECVLEFTGEDYRFDSFNEGTIINFMNIVKIYAVSSDYPTGTLIYIGYISKYEPFILSNKEGCKVKAGNLKPGDKPEAEFEIKASEIKKVVK